MIRLMVSAAILAVCGALYGADTLQDSAAEAPSTLKSVTAGKFTLSYKIDGKNLSGILTYPAEGWIAVGFGAKSAMSRAHIIQGGIVNQRSVVLEEYGTGMFSHKPLNQIKGTRTLITGECTFVRNETTLSFTFPLDNGGNRFASLAPGQQIKVIFAYGKGTDLTKKHSDKASVKITL